jgi:3-deoxy-D-manno-octulosonate 8-phosphate phosphatase (KDO 8-P phosphatase)
MDDGLETRLDAGLRERLRRVRLLLLDVDGVLTDGGLFYGSGDAEMKRFDVKDGAGMFLAGKFGLEVGLLTGKSSPMVAKRAQELGLTRVVQGALDKVPALETILGDGRYSLREVGYVGDDVLDLPVIRRAGFSACPSDAHPLVRERVDYVCEHRGGSGAVREVIDLILAAQGKWRLVLEQYWEDAHA